MMKLYFSPLACSLATRIALYEAGANAEFEEVDPKTKRTKAGRDFHELHPLGLVPTLQLPNGKLLTENAAVLQYVARAFPDARLAPNDAEGVAELQSWLCFIGTELHKSLFTPLLAKQAGPDAKAYALGLAESRLGYLSRHLANREFLLDRFSVADCYLFTILNWSQATPVDLKPWPVLGAYQARLQERPSFARAFAEELQLYKQERSRHAPEAGSTGEVLQRFNSAFLEHDPTRLDDLIAEDCFVENTTPAPLGARHEGRAACLALWRGLAENNAAHFELEDVQVAGELGTIRWRYVWGKAPSEAVRGVNLMRVKDGRIVEARGYVKGA
jgi:glutathione S-transferase